MKRIEKEREKEHAEHEADKRRLDKGHPQRIWEITRKSGSGAILVVILKWLRFSRKFLLSPLVWNYELIREHSKDALKFEYLTDATPLGF